MPHRLLRALAVAAFAMLYPLAGRASAAAGTAKDAAPRQQIKVAAGDLLAQKGEDGIWHSVRILQVDRMPDGSPVAHCLFYTDAKERPTLDAVAALGVRDRHMMVLAGFFGTGWERIGNRPPTKAEMAGYYDYLKHTDFPRYAKLTGLDEQAVARVANEHYAKAVALDDKGDKRGAIIEYSIALDSYPMFVEAIDNRGLDFMDLGDCKEAVADFEMSLGIKPDGEAAFVSRGECLLRMGKSKEAATVFAEAIRRFPARKADLQKSLDQARASQKAHQNPSR